jgi:hypothetical protein
VRLRESSPGVFRLDHDRDRHDDRAVALALAASYLVERPTATPLRHGSIAGRLPVRALPQGSDRYGHFEANDPIRTRRGGENTFVFTPQSREAWRKSMLEGRGER